MINNSRRHLLKLGLSLMLVFFLFFALGETNATLTFELKKARTRGEEPVRISKKAIAPAKAGEAMITGFSLTEVKKLPAVKKVAGPGPCCDSMSGAAGVADTSCKEKVMLIGDSQLEGLRAPVNAYCDANNCELISTVMWYGSSTRQWGETDTLDYFIKRYKPTLVLIAIGLNELFVNDLDERRIYINDILNKFRDHDVKFYWIGPAAWTKDKGIIDVMAQEVGKPFYPSHLLTLERANDKRHPSRDAAKIWFDSVAVAITRQGELDFSKKKVLVSSLRKSPVIILDQVH
ncbi:MAG: SGNH/GDSL hydrolase family protein [Bacteroidia bacterium]